MSQYIGQKLRYARKYRNLTQAELACKVALARHTHITHIEAGRRDPSLDLVVRMAHTLQVSNDYFLLDTIPTVALEKYIKPTMDACFSASAFGAKLRTLRLAHNLSQTELTIHLQLSSQGHISGIESGTKEPSKDLVIAIARYFKSTIDSLLIVPSK